MIWMHFKEMKLNLLQKNKYWIVRLMPKLYRYFSHRRLPKDPVEFRKYLFAKFIIKPGDISLDIGAHIGVFSRMFSSMVGDTGRVYAFEPNPYIFSLMSRIVGNTNIVAENFAVSNQNLSQCDFFVKPYTLTENATLKKRSTAHFFDNDHLTKKVYVKTICLDQYLKQEIRKISFIKMDVEGNEENVILGADQVIQKNRPTIIFEYSFEEGRFEPKTIELLCKYHYRFVDIENLQAIENFPYIHHEHTDILAYPLEREKDMKLLIEVLKKFPSEGD